jgi:helicase required for RNAi-mediated heterochromatin assembly 1
MVPEIRRALAPIYPFLEDHPSVLEKAEVPGMGTVASYLFTHRWQESSDSFSSRVNHTEASMVVATFNYLVLNGLDASEITVLTFYNGQRKLILKLLKGHSNLSGRFFNVKTVDSYQGKRVSAARAVLVSPCSRRS